MERIEHEGEGAIVAFAMPDGGLGEAHLCVHPILRTPELEFEMLELAEDRLSTRAGNGRRRLRVWAPETDSLRKAILESRGYARNGLPERKWRRALGDDISEAPVAPGYAIRPLGDGLELVERCYASGLAFHEGDLAIASRDRDDVSWYRNIQNAPLYRRDLDLAAIAPDGSIGAFCGIWFDDATRSACFEPVATVPAHRRRGLQRSLMIEGLRRLKRMGALFATVGGYSPEANALYRSVMGDDLELYESWDREWD
jgi:mycothiol synthase